MNRLAIKILFLLRLILLPFVVSHEQAILGFVTPHNRPKPSEVSVGLAGFGGLGCPPNGDSLQLAVDESKCSWNLTMTAFKADSSQSRSNCLSVVQVSPPPFWQFGVKESGIRGLVEGEKRIMSSIQGYLYFGGERDTVRLHSLTDFRC